MDKGNNLNHWDDEVLWALTVWTQQLVYQLVLVLEDILDVVYMVPILFV
jgi:hypothetical protein